MNIKLLFLIINFFSVSVFAQQQLTSEQMKAALTQRRYQLIAQLVQFQEQGKIKEAITAAEKNLEIEKRLTGGTHQMVLDTLNKLSYLYENSGGIKQAIQYKKESLDVTEKLYGKSHWRTIDSKLNLEKLEFTLKVSPAQKKLIEKALQATSQALKLFQNRKYAQAIPLFTSVVKNYKEVYGEQHPDYASSLNNLALLYKLTGDHAKAEPLYLKTIKIRKEILGGAHPHYAASLNNLAALYQSMEDHVKAESFYQQALQVKKEAFGVKHPEYTTSLNSLAVLFYRMGEYSKAELLYQQALQIKKEAFGEKHAEYTRSLNNLALLYCHMREYSKAEPLYQQALQITKETLGEKNPEYTRSLNNLAVLYNYMGDYHKAEPLYREVLEIKKDTLGEKHPNYSASLNNLAGIYNSIGDYAKAESLYRQALQIRREVFGEKHPEYAASLNNLAMLYLAMGDYPKAEPLFQQALQITKETLGQKHHFYATSLNNLALLYKTMGDYAKAEPLYQQALQIRREAFGEKHPDYAAGLNNLAILYLSMGDYPKAEPLFQQALQRTKEALGEKHPDYANGLYNLAGLYLSINDYPKAESMLKQALQITKEAFGKKHPHYAMSLDGLAVSYLSMGDYSKVEPLFQQALQIRKEALGEKHPDYANSLNNLAGIYSSLGDYPKAESMLKQALAISLENLSSSATVQSERQQLEMTKSLRHQMDLFLSLGIRSPQASKSSYSSWNAWKGAVSLRQRSIKTQQNNPQLAQLFSELNSTVSQLATLSFKTPLPTQKESWSKQIEILSAKKEKIERKLSSESSEFRQAKKQISLIDLQTSLPLDFKLIDFVEFTYAFTREGQPSPQFKKHLAVFLIGKKQDPILIDLGESETIHNLINTWRQSFGTSTEGQLAAKTLREKIWEPISEHVKHTKVILVSPDGALGKFPLAALPGSKPNTYLIEEYPIAIIPSPRSLVDQQTEQTNKPTLQQMLLIGGVDYEQAGSQPVQLAGTRSIAWMEKPQFGFLPGALEEVKKIEELARVFAPKSERITLTGKEASEEQFRLRAPQANYLHIATHGFFAPPEVKNALTSGDGKQQMMSFNQQKQQIQGFHPGLLSGLVFAGANNPKPDHETGIMTAEEVGTLNLENCELAVLSACETGLGQVAGGEGVLGLQRAFDIAGAKTTITSLWKVHDEATRLLMERFYNNLWNKKMGKLEALREAQLWMLSGQSLKEAKARGLVELEQDAPNEGRLPPYYWAAFVLSGDWR